jgi:hypothetical protein
MSAMGAALCENLIKRMWRLNGYPLLATDTARESFPGRSYV